MNPDRLNPFAHTLISTILSLINLFKFNSFRRICTMFVKICPGFCFPCPKGIFGNVAHSGLPVGSRERKTRRAAAVTFVLCERGKGVSSAAGAEGKELGEVVSSTADMKDVASSSSPVDCNDVSSGAVVVPGSKQRRGRRKKAACPSRSTDGSGASKASEPVEEKRLKRKRRRRRHGVASTHKQETFESKDNMTTSEQAKARLSHTQMNARRSSSHKKQINGHPGENTEVELPQAEIENDNLAQEIENANLDKKNKNKNENEKLDKKSENKKLEQNSSIQKNKNLKEKNLEPKIENDRSELYIENKPTMMQISSTLQDASVGVTKEEMQEEVSVSGSDTREDEEKPFSIQSICEIFSKELLQRTVGDSTYDQKAQTEGNLSKMTISSARNLHSVTKRKLLILDLNGLLADIVASVPAGCKPDKRVNSKAVFKRPFCDDFLKFCFDRFDMAVWSSRRKDNVKTVVDFLMADLKHKLLFCWDQSKCTTTGFGTVENRHKPIFFKELKKVWDKEEPDLPWEKGYYGPSNTILLDDSPYKALRNPPYTAIFPSPYSVGDHNDNSLGPGGDIRVYLEGLVEVDNVQEYIQEHPFGQRSITPSNPSWPFYLQVMGLESSSITSQLH